MTRRLALRYAIAAGLGYAGAIVAGIVWLALS